MSTEKVVRPSTNTAQCRKLPAAAAAAAGRYESCVRPPLTATPGQAVFSGGTTVSLPNRGETIVSLAKPW